MLSKSFAVILFSLVLIPQSAGAFLSLVRQGAESADVPNTNDHHGREVCAGDFDGNGVDELAIAAPDESNGQINTAAHGKVIISNSSARGITTAGAKSIDIGDLGTEAARFGWSMVAADFNLDGRDDLAVGIPQVNHLGGDTRGAVYIYAGSPGGLQLAPYLQIFYNDVESFPEDFAYFGWDMTSGDFDDDTYPDLAVSAIGHGDDTGVVYFFFGGNAGLTTNGSQQLFPFTVGGSDALGGQFGYSLAAGQMDGFPGDDLAIGAPKTDVLGQNSSGRVYFYYSNGNGISGNNGWYLDASNMAANIEPNGDAHLGFSLAAGHFFQPSGQMDVAVGTPKDDYGQQNDAGSVLLVEFEGAPDFYASLKKLRQHAISNTTDASPGDQFGYSLAAGKWEAGTYHDLAIGVPYEDVTEDAVLGPQSNSGMFHVVPGKAGGPSMWDAKNFNMITLNNFPDAGANLGQALCFGSFDTSGRQAVAAGAPNADYDSYEWGGTNISNAGQVHIAAPWRQPNNHPHRSSVLLDCDGFIVYGQRPFQRVRPASTTKTMTLLLACEAIWNGDVDPDHLYTVPGWVADQVGGSQTPLVEGEKLKFVGLMQTMMAVSGNDSAMLIGSILSGDGGPWEGFDGTSPAFAQDMEQRANQLGLSSSTSLTNAAGIDSGDHYVTALDWATLGYLAIQHECVKTIVNTSPWLVERVVPNGEIMSGWFTTGGGGGSDISIFEEFYAGWVDGVKSRYAKAVGIKPGGTPGGWRTGLSAGQPGGLISGHTAASSFGTRPDDEPDEGVDGGCSTCLHGDLLKLGEEYCSGGTSDDFAPNPEPGPKPWGTLTNVPPCPEEGVHAMSLNLAEEQVLPPGRIVQFDVMRNGYTDPLITVRQAISRTTQMKIDSDDLVPFGISPHESNDGLEITNDGTTSASFVVNWNGQALTFGLAPGESATIPGFIQFAPAFNFSIQSLQRTDILLGIRELGYKFEHKLRDGIVGPDAESVQLVRAGYLLAENIEVFLQGQESDCGDDVLDLVARADDGVPTGILDGTDFLPPAPAAMRLLPNYPNPFNPNTLLRFDLPRGASVDLAIYDARGRRVRTLVSGAFMEAGRHQLEWNGTDDGGIAVASGVYTLRLLSDGKQEIQRMTLLK